METYRLRWQIELEFTRLKSLIELGHLKKHDARAARSWLQGKLLVALLIARMMAHAERVSPWGYEMSWFADKGKLSVA
jgi:IS4 transposase